MFFFVECLNPIGCVCSKMFGAKSVALQQASTSELYTMPDLKVLAPQFKILSRCFVLTCLYNFTPCLTAALRRIRALKWLLNSSGRKAQNSQSRGIQSRCQRMIGVSNHLLSKVFRFHYHSQKVIGSLGQCDIHIAAPP